MQKASVLTEAVRFRETIGTTCERMAMQEHVARHYPQIALPALAAAMRRTSRPCSTKAPGSADTSR
jgi:hypothetical protein